MNNQKSKVNYIYSSINNKSLQPLIYLSNYILMITALKLSSIEGHTTSTKKQHHTSGLKEATSSEYLASEKMTHSE